MKTTWFRTAFITFAVLGLTLAAVGCQWVNIPGPY
jgi:hypothetical protein